MKQRYGDRVEFLNIYVREAHPTDGWRMESNDKAGVTFAQPTTNAQREAAAAKCCAALKMTIPTLVDAIDDRVGHLYSGMPDRLYLIDKQGFIVYKGGRGPFGFKPGELEQTIIMHLADQNRKPTPVGEADPWKRLPQTEGQPAPAARPAWVSPLVDSLPKTTAAMLELDYLHRVKNPLDAKLRAKVRWIAAHVNRSPYGEATALADLRHAGASEDDIKQFTSAPEADPAHREAFIFARKLTREAYKVTDEEMASLRAKLGDAKVVALVQLLAYANFQDRLMHSLGLNAAEHAAEPFAVRFRKPWSGAAAPAERQSPSSNNVSTSARVEDGEWSKLDFTYLQAKLESQKAREPRIPVPPFDLIRPHLPPTFPKGKELKIQWSLVCLGYQPELASAWTLCTRTFGEEANQDRVFEELLFWVVTRELQCFY